MGPNAQEEIAIGVGALAGSTVTLLTIPWFLTVMGGRVDVREDGTLNYRKPPGELDWKKLTPNNCSPSGSAVGSGSYVAKQGQVMMLLSLLYLVIQIPSLEIGAKQKLPTNMESLSALVGTALCFAGFVWYLIREFRRADESLEVQSKTNAIRIQAISGKWMTLKGVMFELLNLQRQEQEQTGQVGQMGVNNESLIPYRPTYGAKVQMATLLKPFFQHLDFDNSGSLNRQEARALFVELSGTCSEAEINFYFSMADKDSSGFIEFDEFVDTMIKYVIHQEASIQRMVTETGVDKLNRPPSSEIEEEEEKEEMPEDLADLSPSEQQKRVLFRAFSMMAFGTILVLVFSDPMVDVLSNLGERTGIPAFYISFVFAPLASNASEIVAAFSYSKKKTRPTASIAFSTLCGAACMNNTFVLGIFLALVYFKDILWVYTAETASILLIQLCIGILSQKEKQYFWCGIVALLCYPMSLAVIVMMKK
eukprot:Selendium_serpulae@DN4327_c0_g1_i1.p1